MLFWIIQRTILSLVFIIILHYIYLFFKENLTTPKIKDLINKPKFQYKEIYKSMNKEKTDNNMMKSELQNYFKNLTKTTTDNTPPSVKDFSFSNSNDLQYQSI